MAGVTPQQAVELFTQVLTSLGYSKQKTTNTPELDTSELQKEVNRSKDVLNEEIKARNAAIKGLKIDPLKRLRAAFNVDPDLINQKLSTAADKINVDSLNEKMPTLSEIMGNSISIDSKLINDKISKNLEEKLSTAGEKLNTEGLNTDALNEKLSIAGDILGNSIDTDILNEKLSASGELLSNAMKEYTDYGDLQREIVTKFNASLGKELTKLGITVSSLDDVLKLEELAALSNDWIKANKKGIDGTEEQLEILEKIEKLDIPKELKDYVYQLDNAKNVVNEFSTSLGEASDQAVNAKGVRTKLNEAGRELNKSFIKMIDSFFSVNSAMLTLKKSLVQAYNDSKQSMKFGTLFEEGSTIFSNQIDAMKLGIDPSTLSEISAVNRQAVLAIGGTTDFMAAMNPLQEEMFGVIGDNVDAAKFVGNTMTSLGKLGIAPSVDALREFGKGITATGQKVQGSFTYFNKALGFSTEQFGALIEEMGSEVGVRKRLQAANETERKQIIQGVLGRIEELTAMGLSTEQAKEQVKAQEALLGDGPRERFKKAAKLQATMGALGVQGGGEAAGILRKGERASKEERARLDELISQTQGKVAETATGSLASEFLASGIVQRTDMEGLLGPASPFAMQLGEGLKQQTGIMGELFTLTEKAPWLTDVLKGINSLTTNLAQNPLLSAGLGAIQGLGSILAGPILGALLVGGVSGGMGNALGNMGKFAKGLGGLALTGGAIGAAVYGVSQFAQAVTTGKSDVNSFLQTLNPDIMENVGDAIGATVDGIAEFFDLGNARDDASRAKFIENQAAGANKQMDQLNKKAEEKAAAERGSAENIQSAILEGIAKASAASEKQFKLSEQQYKIYKEQNGLTREQLDANIATKKATEKLANKKPQKDVSRSG